MTGGTVDWRRVSERLATTLARIENLATALASDTGAGRLDIASIKAQASAGCRTFDEAVKAEGNPNG